MPRIVSNRPSPPMVYTKKYEKFSGVDFPTDPATLQDNRSPYSVNILSDSGGYPEKRVGWRALRNFDSAINGIYHLENKIIIHAGDKMHLMENENAEPTLLMEGLNDAKSFGIVFVGKLWILTGKEYLCYPHEVEEEDENGEPIYVQKMVHVHDIATVPQVLSQVEVGTDGAMTGGISYQPFNLLTPNRKIGVTLKSGTKISVTQPAEGTISVISTISGRNVAKSRADVYNGGSWAAEEIVLRTDSANPANDLPDGTHGMPDGLMVEYTPLTDIPAIDRNKYSEETKEQINATKERVEANRRIIEGCTFGAIYENRLFVSGNPDFPNTDFYCELKDPTYFSDVGYSGIGTADEAVNENEAEERKKSYVGTGGTKIMGYSYVGQNLAIHKDGAENGASLYLRSSSMTENGMIFPITEGIVGESIVSSRATASFIDDPIFLTKSGVYAVASADITSERTLQSRSTRVNAKLTLESGLENAEMCVHNGYLYLFINGNVYVADSRQKSYVRNISNAYEYEWYFWDSIPARVVKAFNDTVYFGTDDGLLCRFNNDMLDGRGGYTMRAYNDGRKVWDDEDIGNPIVAYWSTKMDDMGDFNTLKHLKRRGSGVYVKSFNTTNIQVLVRTDRDFGNQVTYARRGLFNFETLDFKNFTFNTLPFSFVPFGRKVKDWRMMQVILKNDEINQALGVYAVELRYTKGYFAK